MSWGGSTRGVRIERNVLQGGTVGLRLHASDTDVVVEQNVSNGLLVTAPPPDSWRVNGNVWTSLSYQQQRLAPPPKVTQGLLIPDQAIAEGRLPANVCAALSRIAPAPSAPDGAATIGADLRCPP